MAKLKLTYFDFPAGRGEPARLALSLGGVAFEDERVSVADWPKRKPDTLFGSLPELEVDGQVFAQSNAINRYIGKLAGLYPEDPFQAALCDEAMETVEDIAALLGPTLFLPEEQKKARRKELAEGPLPFFATRLSQRLVSHGGQYFADNRLTVADLKVFGAVRWQTSGVLDHIPTDLIGRVAPKLIEHYNRLKAHAGIRSYYEKLGITL